MGDRKGSPLHYTNVIENLSEYVLIYSLLTFQRLHQNQTPPRNKEKATYWGNGP